MCSLQDIPYFQNSDEFDGSMGARLYELKIKPKDKLTIFVFSSNNQDAVAQFNIRDPREMNLNQRLVRVQSRAS